MVLFDSNINGNSGPAASADSSPDKTIQVTVEGVATVVLEASEGEDLWYQLTSFTASGIFLDSALRASIRARRTSGAGRVRVFMTKSG